MPLSMLKVGDSAVVSAIKGNDSTKNCSVSKWRRYDSQSHGVQNSIGQRYDY